jgi:hypothetical protein
VWILALLLAQTPDINRYLLWSSAAAQPFVAVAPAFPRGLVTGPGGLTVTLEVDVGPDGLVKRARIVEGRNTEAAIAAFVAIYRWRFHSGASSDRPVRVTMVFRTMPADTPVEELTTAFRGAYEVEVRRPVDPD